MPQSVQLESPQEAGVIKEPAVKPDASARVVSLDVLDCQPAGERAELWAHAGSCGMAGAVADRAGHFSALSVVTSDLFHV